MSACLSPSVDMMSIFFSTLFLFSSWFYFHCNLLDIELLCIHLLGLLNEIHHNNHNHFMALFGDHPGEPVPDENFWTLWCKGRLTEADTLTIRLGATPSRLTSAHLHHPPIFFTGQMPFLPPNQQRQSTEGN